MSSARWLGNVALGAILLGALTSCATVTQEYQDGDHKEVYGIDCSGKAVSLATCYDKAKSLCPAGYTVIANQARIPIGPDLIGAVTYTVDASDSDVRKGITIRCS